MRDISQKNLVILTVLISFIVGGVSGGIVRPFIDARQINLSPGGASPDTQEKKLFGISRGEESVEEIVSQSVDAVVSIVIEKEISGAQERGSKKIIDPFENSPFLNDPFFREFFPEFRIEIEPQGPPAPEESDKNSKQQRRKVRVGGGSGFIVSRDGLILTNKHVVADADAIYTVVLNDKREFKAAVLAKDPVLDLAVVKIEADNLPTLRFGDSSKIRLGQKVIAIGFSLAEFSNTVTQGIISGIGRRVVAGDNRGASEVIEEAIQTDAAINPGNSGGPLLNMSGEVIGINTAISSQGQSVGFAIPSNTAERIVNSVKEHGRIVRPWLGVRYVLITREIKEANNLAADHGALVTGDEKNPAVMPDSPAQKAGIKENDIILKVNNVNVDETHSLAGLIANYKPSETINLTILRDGKELVFKVTIAEFPQNLK